MDEVTKEQAQALAADVIKLVVAGCVADSSSDSSWITRSIGTPQTKFSLPVRTPRVPTARAGNNKTSKLTRVGMAKVGS